MSWRVRQWDENAQMSWRVQQDERDEMSWTMEVGKAVRL